MALPKTAANVNKPQVSPRGQLVDLADLCRKLEDRLLVDERDISKMRSRGDDTSEREVSWIRMLRRYERVCDLLAASVPAEQASAA